MSIGMVSVWLSGWSVLVVLAFHASAIESRDALIIHAAAIMRSDQTR